MNYCVNCGQSNDREANFCRFCGTKGSFAPQPQSAQYPPQYNEAPPAPRPYAWKTDEFSVGDLPNAKTNETFNQQLSQQNYQRSTPAFNPGYQPQHPAYLANLNYRCPHCGTQNPPMVQRKISTAGWIVFAALLIFFFPLFWIGLLIKDDVRTCSVCRYQID